MDWINDLDVTATSDGKKPITDLLEPIAEALAAMPGYKDKPTSAVQKSEFALAFFHQPRIPI